MLQINDIREYYTNASVIDPKTINTQLSEAETSNIEKFLRKMDLTINYIDKFTRFLENLSK